jgi:putative component of toxin-antitoxin plasmid stabilization module
VVDELERVAVEVIFSRLRRSEMGERGDQRSIEDGYPERLGVAVGGGWTESDVQY